MPDRIRTYDLLLRKQTLYPAELRAHVDADALGEAQEALPRDFDIHLEIKRASRLNVTR